MPEQNVVKRDASGKKAFCHVANGFLSRLELLWSTPSLKISKMSKNAFLAPSSKSQWVKGSRGSTFEKQVHYYHVEICKFSNN